jgi:hypothetical protein
VTTRPRSRRCPVTGGGQLRPAAWCGGPMQPKPRGRIPKWCSPACRQRAWEQARAATSSLAAVRVVERRWRSFTAHDRLSCCCNTKGALHLILTCRDRVCLGPDQRTDGSTLLVKKRSGPYPVLAVQGQGSSVVPNAERLRGRGRAHPPAQDAAGGSLGRAVHGVTSVLNGCYLSGMPRKPLASRRNSSLGQRSTDSGPGSVGPSASRPYKPGPGVSWISPAMPSDGRWRPTCATGGDTKARESLRAVKQQMTRS